MATVVLEMAGLDILCPFVSRLLILVHPSALDVENICQF